MPAARRPIRWAIAALGGAAIVACLVLVAIVPGGGRRAERLMPWYEVASAGDGLGPESVNMWKVPPTATFVHPNAFQDPTKWNGDHVLNGGNKEWAEEDAALHAYNMENWRNKILQTQLHRQKQQYMLMNTGGPPNSGKRSTSQSLAISTPQSTVAAAAAASAAAAAAATEKQDLGLMMKQLSKALVHPKKAGTRGRSSRDRSGGSSEDAQLVKLEEGNQTLLRRILRQLRHRRSHARHDTYR
jgi:hypothetical protein